MCLMRTDFVWSVSDAADHVEFVFAMFQFVSLPEVTNGMTGSERKSVVRCWLWNRLGWAGTRNG